MIKQLFIDKLKEMDNGPYHMKLALSRLKKDIKSFDDLINLPDDEFVDTVQFLIMKGSRQR